MPSPPLRIRISFSRPLRLLPLVAFALCASALTGLGCNRAGAQAMATGEQSPSGVGATSPLSLEPGSTVPPVGIPLGSTEIATPGISPTAPLSSAASIPGVTNCAASGNSRSSSGAPFDGGGVSGGASASCATAGDATASGSPVSASSVGRAGIPLGSTELGGAGLSPAVPVTAPNTISANPASSGVAIPCPDTGVSSSMTAGSAGC